MPLMEVRPALGNEARDKKTQTLGFPQASALLRIMAKSKERVCGY